MLLVLPADRAETLPQDTERMVSMLDEAEEAAPGASKANGEEDWVETHSSTHPSASSASGGTGADGRPAEIPEIPDLEPYPPPAAAERSPPAHSAVPDESSLASLTLDDQSVHAVVGGDDEIPDLDDIPDMDDEMDGFGGGLMEEEDEATARPAAAASHEDESNLLAVRTYDVMITCVPPCTTGCRAWADLRRASC